MMRALRPRAGVSLPCMMALLCACASGWEPAFDEVAPSGQFETLAIADPEEALTFARAEIDGQRRVILVAEYNAGLVRGVDLARAVNQDIDDPLTALDALGYDRLLNLARSAPRKAWIEVPAAQLGIPIDLGDHHIAAGTNFPEHGDDAGVEDGPFLFAKLVRPTGPYAPVAQGDGLLDYEVEVAWVALDPVAPGDGQARVGLILANDFTDRATLMRALDPWDIASGTGFTTGKSFPGFLPVGNLFVVPRDHRRFVPGLALELYVNGGLRQRSKAGEMIWDFDETIAQTFARRDVRWDHRGESVSLLNGADAIPARTLILSGTPHGTVFAGVQPRHYAGGLAKWLLGGWDQPLPASVISSYIDDARQAGVYLRAGDRVEIRVDRLGVLRNDITS